MPSFERILPRDHHLPLLFLLALSFFTIVQGFWSPQALFWDENYHVASAQKYLNGVFFMEPHPPLGKLLIAAGEALLDRNILDDQFIGTDYATNPPEGFDFTGYRLFPVLLAWLTVPLLYAIFFVLTKRPLWAMLLSLLFVLDNALLVHARSAMLDSTMLFFSAATILAFLLLLRVKDNRHLLPLSAFFGIAFACALATKVFTLLFVLLVPITAWHLLRSRRDRTIFFGITIGVLLMTEVLSELAYRLYWYAIEMNMSALTNVALFLEKLFFPIGIVIVAVTAWQLWIRLPASRAHLLRFFLPSLCAFLVVYGGIWYLHFSIARTVNPDLPDGGYYQSSERGTAILDAGMSASPLAFPVLFLDAHAFVSHYEAGVPVLDLAKADENGSPWFLWPVGARTINYRWATPDGYSYRYLYLVPNPVVWGIALLSVLLGILFFLAPYLSPGFPKSPLHFELGTFLLLYACFLAAVSRIERVMYLYHYFLPLFFTFILVGIVVVSLTHVGKIKLTDEHKTLGLLTLGVLVFLGFQAYRPFTYYAPMTDDAVTRRAIFNIWDMHCVKCEAPHVLAKPTK